MNLGDIFITYLEYEDVPNGKSRPVLYIEQDDEFYYVFKITNKYQNKSKSIRAKYAKITDWQKSGLNKESWIDCNKRYQLRIDKTRLKGIGNLTITDLNNLKKFIW